MLIGREDLREYLLEYDKEIQNEIEKHKADFKLRIGNYIVNNISKPNELKKIIDYFYSFLEKFYNNDLSREAIKDSVCKLKKIIQEEVSIADNRCKTEMSILLMLSSVNIII